MTRRNPQGKDEEMAEKSIWGQLKQGQRATTWACLGK